MSSFNGKTHEFPEVSLDRFDGDNLNSTVFFLSHCHFDHMIGLDSPLLCNRLRHLAGRSKIYTHPVSIALLKSWQDAKYDDILPYIEGAAVDDPFLVDVINGNIDHAKYTIEVTLISAGKFMRTRTYAFVFN